MIAQEALSRMIALAWALSFGQVALNGTPTAVECYEELGLALGLVELRVYVLTWAH
jgi:hypothetical protein